MSYRDVREMSLGRSICCKLSRMHNERVVVMWEKCHSVARSVVNFHACAMNELSLCGGNVTRSLVF